MKNKHLFSLIEMMVVICIITLLISIAFPYLRDARIKGMKVTTRNMLNQQKAMVSAYYTDYGTLPVPGHVDSKTFNDGTASRYWDRVSKELRPLTQINSKNAELFFDRFDNEEGGSLKTESEFVTMFPTRDLIIKLEPWQVSPTAPFTPEQDEENRVIAHSSRFLNYYLSGSGFDLVKDGSYLKSDEKWLANDDSSFRLSYQKSAMVKPWLFVATNNFMAWDASNAPVTTIPSVTSYLLNSKTLLYFDYLPKILSPSNLKSLNLTHANGDIARRLYNYSDSQYTPPPANKPFESKLVTLGSDRLIFNVNYFNHLSGAANAITQGSLKNSDTTIYMRAHNDNVKEIVDAFNTPIVYITYVNQRLASAKTFKDAIPAKDKALRSDSFILYSLGPNKADDSNLGENYTDKGKTGDDIIEATGGK